MKTLTIPDNISSAALGGKNRTSGQTGSSSFTETLQGAIREANALQNQAEEAVKNLLKIEILYRDTAVFHDARLRLLEIYVKTKQKKDAKNLKAEIMKSSAPKALKDRANELIKK